MKLEKAIEILSDIDYGFRDGFSQDEQDALKLGIEALRQVQKFQQMGSKIHPLRLPGETES